MAFPRIAPDGASTAGDLVLRSAEPETSPFTSLAANPCLSGDTAPEPQPWATGTWYYDRADADAGQGAAELTITGWPQGAAKVGMSHLVDNSGACTFDRQPTMTAWPGLAATDGNQFVVEAEFPAPGTNLVAVRRVGDVTISARVRMTDEAKGLQRARALADGAAANLVDSKALDAPEPYVWTWPPGTSEGFEPKTAFILPDIAPDASAAGVQSLREPDPDPGDRNVPDMVPVFGAQFGSPEDGGRRAVAARAASYFLSVPDRGGQDYPRTWMVWSSYPDGPKAFDEIVADKGIARWAGPMRRENWSGRDRDVTFLGVLSGQERPTVVALRLEGDVLISVSAEADKTTDARRIATRLADAAAKNLASLGLGPDGRPGTKP